ncbi:MAG: OsmC family protein [Gammaproteobacteria bacterium]
MENSKVTIVRESSQGKYAQEINTGNHTLVADEPTALGGNDAGPSPYEFLLAALGACTSITLRMYAEHKFIPLRNIVVKLTHDKIHVKDCASCDDDNSKIDRIERKIELQGELDDEQRQRLLAIANKCPVHRTLASTILINTSLTD